MNGMYLKTVLTIVTITGATIISAQEQGPFSGRGVRKTTSEVTKNGRQRVLPSPLPGTENRLVIPKAKKIAQLKLNALRADAGAQSNPGQLEEGDFEFTEGDFEGSRYDVWKLDVKRGMTYHFHLSGDFKRRLQVLDKTNKDVVLASQKISDPQNRPRYYTTTMQSFTAKATGTVTVLVYSEAAKRSAKYELSVFELEDEEIPDAKKWIILELFASFV